MYWAKIYLRVVAATFAAAQGFSDDIVKDVQHVDRSAASQQVGTGAAITFPGAKFVVSKMLGDVQQAVGVEVFKLIEQGAGPPIEVAKQTLEKAVKEMQQADWASTTAALQNNGATPFEAAKEAFGKTIEGLQEVKWEDVPEAAKEYMIKHPVLTAIEFMALLLVLQPWLLSAPALAVVGFEEIGPAAASYAAWYQSVYGTDLVFSGLQSAAMGGYGAAVVDGMIESSALATLIAAEVFKHTGAEELRFAEHAQHEYEL